jgi:Protein of unknown function DUF262
MPSLLEQYPASDFLDWQQKKTLVLNPHFQRRDIWTPAARSYLIDTILRQMPIPKIYLRTKIDPRTKKTLREVVDGQQRLRAILDFIDGRLRLGKHAGEFKGMTFDDLAEEQQISFLGYRLAVDQLVNATDEDVLEIFGRLNSYNLVLKPPEKRHAKYQGEFKWAVYESARKWKQLWEDYKILSVRQRVRMADDSMMAELYGILLEGVRDGDERSLDRLYAKYEKDFHEDETKERLRRTLERLIGTLGEAVSGALASRPHFVLLFAAVAHRVVGIPSGGVDDMPNREMPALEDPAMAMVNLMQLAEIIESEEPPDSEKAQAFWTASRAATVRAASRRVRFLMFWEALLPEPMQL